MVTAELKATSEASEKSVGTKISFNSSNFMLLDTPSEFRLAEPYSYRSRLRSTVRLDRVSMVQSLHATCRCPFSR